jgi:1-acyl-sn-glycerol-3-phosphate acyltransferase
VTERKRATTVSLARSLFNVLGLGILTFVWSIAAIVALPFGPSVVLRIAAIWSRQILFVCGVEVDCGPPPVALDRSAYLVMANHTSHFDVLSLYATLPIRGMRPVAKRELGYIPLFGWALALGAAIMIDRGNRDRAVASIERAAKTIRSGRSVLMFPEGTRTPQGELGPLKKGPFHLAVEAKVPIVPIGIHGTGDVLESGDWRIRPGRVAIRIGAPIDTGGREGDEGRDALMREVEIALSRLIADAAKAL